MEIHSMRKTSLAFVIGIIMIFGIFPVSAFADTNDEYTYVYAGLTWQEYWESEGVYLSGSDWTAASDTTDSNNERDKGAFDTVSRATTNHGLHRGSYQCTAVIEATDDEEALGEVTHRFQVSHWTSANAAVLTDGSGINFTKGTVTYDNDKKAYMKNYKVTGIKYVPVKVKTSDYAAFKEKYAVTENGQTIAGGYGENQLKAYSKTAQVTEKTNGLKTAEKQSDGSFSFSARQTGSDSGIQDQTQTKTEIPPTVLADDAVGSYGEFLRVDFDKTTDYGDLGANMQAVRWDYYGTDSTYSKKLASYGTKFAADNWMHKSNGIQMGLTDSLRCQLPAGTDGTGFWKLTVYALGYEDHTVSFEAKANNIKAAADPVENTKDLQAAVDKAKALKQSDYTAASWADMQTELAEAEDMLKTLPSQASVDEATRHLEEAIRNLVLVEKPAVKLDKTKTMVYKAKTVTLKATVTGTSSKAIWKSSNTSVATVNAKGVVTAKKAGTATITASAGGATAKCTITVKNPILKLTKSNATVKKGKTVKIKATATPAAKIIYKSSNKKIATVTSKGVVKGKKKGTAKITVSANGMKKTFKVKVK